MTLRNRYKRFVAAAAGIGSVLGAATLHAQPARYDVLANSPLLENRPAPGTQKLLKEELFFQRATQVYLWALPLLNTLGMKTGSERQFGAGYNVLPVWKQRVDAATLITTPNSDVIYAMGYLDLGKDGPIVFEAPPGLQGILLDCWQRPIPGPSPFAGDVGLAGPDAGKGGKFLILPPGYGGAVPKGYFVFRSGTNNVFVFLRSFYQDPKQLSPAVKTMEAVKIYPLTEKSPKAMEFPNASRIPVNMLPLSNSNAYDQLKVLLDGEGKYLADADWLGMLASIGIVKGQPFSPDPAARALLERAAKIGYKTSRALAFDETVSGRSFLVYPDRRWLNPAADGTPAKPGGAVDLSFRRTDVGGHRDVDARLWFFTNYYAVSPGMLAQTPGKGAKYLIAFNDGSGKPLSGSASYRLLLPPNVPAANFWSVTLYEAENGSGLANGRPFPSLGSRDEPAQNPDGSTELFIGPRAPAGKEANWLATAPGRGFFAILRLYAPTGPAIDGSWKPGDLERLAR